MAVSRVCHPPLSRSELRKISRPSDGVFPPALPKDRKADLLGACPPSQLALPTPSISGRESLLRPLCPKDSLEQRSRERSFPQRHLSVETRRYPVASAF